MLVISGIENNQFSDVFSFYRNLLSHLGLSINKLGYYLQRNQSCRLYLRLAIKLPIYTVRKSYFDNLVAWKTVHSKTDMRGVIVNF